MKRAPPKRVRRRLDRVVATVHWGPFSDGSTHAMSLEDFLRTRIGQLYWLAAEGEPGPLHEVIHRMAKERVADERRRQTGLKGVKRMKELAAKRRELLEPVFRATDEAAKAKGEQLGRRDLALQARKRVERLKPDDPRRRELTERRARNYRKSPDKN